jgi:hypothetical protein
MRVRLILATWCAVLAVGLLALPSSANAGRLLVTGHDADLHCSFGEPQCHFVKVAVDYVRAGAPDPSKPVLVLDRGTLKMVAALDNAYGAGVVPRTVVDPRSGFAGVPLKTSSFSAILVASDTTCGGCDLNDFTGTPDSDAINARAADIAAFFNDGGGLYVNSGASHGDGNPATGPDNYYSFVPIPIGGAAVAAPFALTAAGRTLGLTDGTGGTSNDINCCATHNSFTLPPAGGALEVAETDSKGFAETLFAEGEISGGTIRKPSKKVIDLPSNKKCVSRRRFRIRIRQPGGIQIQTALVFVNSKKVRVLKRRVFRRLRNVSNVDLRGLPRGTFTVRIVVLTTGGKTIKGKRKYRTCTKRRKTRRPPKL